MGNPKKMQTSNLTGGHRQQNNFGKAVLAIPSAKSKERCICFLVFYFGMHHICFCPNSQNPFSINQL
jgi:hypothetical protein